ncbi:hypothetical protein [Nonomuraea sp. NPDC049695]|uniref:hypothetical protein n=1 Tax=Nonomuraea sp. NPDC049695 TaxID=3154734 RepID=UPI00343EAD4D
MAAASGDEGLMGHGQAAKGLIRAVVGEDGLLARLRLDARAMRLGSEDLAGHVLSAVRAAQQDRLSRAEPSPEENPGMDEFMRRLDEMEAQTAQDFAFVTSSLDEALRRLKEG